MDAQDLIAIGGLLIAFLSLLTSFILQLEKRKIRSLREKNEELKKLALKSLKSIEAYQSVEKKQAKMQNITPSRYRSKVRKGISGFDSTFLSPRNISIKIGEIET